MNIKLHLAIMLTILTTNPAGAVTFNWDPPAVAGYKLHWGPTSGAPTNHLDVGNVLTASVLDSTLGASTYFTVTAYNSAGTESLPSNEVLYTKPVVQDKLRYHPRIGWGSRMVNGVFEGSNVVGGPYTLIHTITAAPTGWVEVQVSLGSYRFLRYRGASGSYCNVAEIEFYRNGSKLQGVGFGTPGAWTAGCTFDKALDGNTSTFFDLPNGNVGIDTQ